jgi:hypothetical protein
VLKIFNNRHPPSERNGLIVFEKIKQKQLIYRSGCVYSVEARKDSAIFNKKPRIQLHSNP